MWDSYDNNYPTQIGVRGYVMAMTGAREQTEVIESVFWATVGVFEICEMSGRYDEIELACENMRELMDMPGWREQNPICTGVWDRVFAMREGADDGVATMVDPRHPSVWGLKDV